MSRGGFGCHSWEEKCHCDRVGRGQDCCWQPPLHAAPVIKTIRPHASAAEMEKHCSRWKFQRRWICFLAWVSALRNKAALRGEEEGAIGAGVPPGRAPVGPHQSFRQLLGNSERSGSGFAPPEAVLSHPVQRQPDLVMSPHPEAKVTAETGPAGGRWEAGVEGRGDCRLHRKSHSQGQGNGSSSEGALHPLPSSFSPDPEHLSCHVHHTWHPEIC